jgi:hypothetical protein
MNNILLIIVSKVKLQNAKLNLNLREKSLFAPHWLPEKISSFSVAVKASNPIQI